MLHLVHRLKRGIRIAIVTGTSDVSLDTNADPMPIANAITPVAIRSHPPIRGRDINLMGCSNRNPTIKHNANPNPTPSNDIPKSG
jgi:hypothetical protein